MEHTYEYAKTLIGLMTKESHKDGKVFIIGASLTLVLEMKNDACNVGFANTHLVVISKAAQSQTLLTSPQLLLV
jgi:succinyl-CoA synthetase alpha subunit